MRRILAFCAVGLLFSVSPSYADICGSIAGNLVVNCGFETGDLTGWTLSGNTSFIGVDGNANSGADAAFMGPVGSDGFLSQVLATTPGNVYQISVWMANDGGTPSDFSVAWNGTSLLSLTNMPASGYTQFVLPSVVAVGLDTLRIGARNDPAFLYVDDVSVGSVVPEPGSMLLLGTGLIAALRFRKGRK